MRTTIRVGVGVDNKAATLNLDGSPTLLSGTTINDSQIDLSWTIGSTNHDGHHIYISTDNVNFTLKDSVLGSISTYSAVGLINYTTYYFKVTAFKSGVQSIASNIVTTKTLYSLGLTSTGTGLGASTLGLKSSATITIKLTGSAKFYDDLACTTNEGTERNVVSGANRTFYLKCPSGSASLIFSDPTKIIKFNDWTSSIVNAAKLSGDICKLTALDYVLIYGNNIVTGDVSKLTACNNLVVYGSNTLYGSIAALTAMTWIEVSGYNTITGSISALVNLTTINTTGLNTLSFPTVINLRSLSSLTIHTSVTVNSANVNQLLADFWANRDYAKPWNTRVINIKGNVQSGQPTGQGLIDKENLKAYRSPNNDAAKNLWAVTTWTESATFFGTSITAGTPGPSVLGNRFSTVLSGLQNLSEINYGIGGNRIYSSATPALSFYNNMSTIIQKPTHAKYLIFDFGANDSDWSSYGTNAFFNMYVEIINFAINSRGWSAANIKVLTCFHTAFDWAALNVVIQSVASNTGVQCIDTGNNLYNAGSYATFMADSVHPNDAGAARMANYIHANIIAP